MTRTVVTGSNGFIGRHLVKRLKDVVLVEHQDIVQGHSYPEHKIFFLSTYGNMAHHTDHGMMLKANVQDVLTLLHGFHGWFCYMSSSSVTLPVQTVYSRAKRGAEEILQALPELKSCIVRPYSVTGVGEQKEHLIPTLIRSCMEGEEMPFDPYPVHDFVDVEDVVDSLVQLSADMSTGIFEIGNGIPYTNQSVRELVEEATGLKANVKERTGLRVYDNNNWICRDSYHPHTFKSLWLSISEMVDAYKRERDYEPS